MQLWQALNALQGMDRYRKEMIQASTYKEWYKGSVSLRFNYHCEIIFFKENLKLDWKKWTRTSVLNCWLMTFKGLLLLWLAKKTLDIWSQNIFPMLSYLSTVIWIQYWLQLSTFSVCPSSFYLFVCLLTLF